MGSKNKCTKCKKYFDREIMINVTAGKFCSRECVKNYGMFKTSELIKTVKKLDRYKFAKRKKHFRDNDRTMQLALTQKAFNKLRVLQELEWFKSRGVTPYCISCSRTNMDWCCGHLKTVGSHSELRYSEHNTHLQCNRYCNMALSGNIEGTKTTNGYKQGLIDRFGSKLAQGKIDKCEKSQAKKWTCDELMKMRKKFNAMIRMVSKG